MNTKNMKIFSYLRLQRKQINLNKLDLIFIYALGGLIGNIYETTLFFIIKGEYVDSSASVISPFNVVYAFGLTLFSFCLYKVNNIFIMFLLAAFLGGFFEYFASIIEEYIFRISSWDYSHLFMNINGRTTIPISLLWGLMGTICVILLPFFFKLIHKLPHKIYLIIAIILLSYICLDWILSFISLLRYSQRMHGDNLDNDFYKWIDYLFNNDYMKKKYPNLIFK